MVGLALVTVVATLGAGLRDSDRERSSSSVDSDYVVISKNGFEPFPAAAGAALPKAPGVTLVSNVRSDQAKAFGDEIMVNGVAPQLRRRLQPQLERGIRRGARPPRERGARSSKRASRTTTACGSATRFSMRSASGRARRLRVAGIQAPTDVQKIDPLLGKVLISQTRLRQLLRRARRTSTRSSTPGAATPAPTPRASRRRCVAFPDAVVQHQGRLGRGAGRAASTTCSTCSTSCSPSR